MKKFFTLLALMLMTSIGAWAGTANTPKNAAAFVDGFCFVLKADDANNTNYFNGSDANNATFTNAMVYRVVMNESGDAFYLRRLTDGKYVPAFVSNNTEFAAMVDDKANAQTFVAKDHVDGGFSHVRLECSNHAGEYINCNSAGVKAKYHNGTGGFSYWNVIDASTLTIVPSTSENPIWYYLNGEASGVAKYLYSEEGQDKVKQDAFSNDNKYKWRIEGETYKDFQIINFDGRHIATETLTFAANGATYASLVNEDGATYHSHFSLGGANSTFQVLNGEGDGTGYYLCVYGRARTETCFYAAHSTCTITATNANQVNVTYTYKTEGADDVVVTVSQIVGSPFAAPIVPAFGSVTSLSNSGLVGIDNSTCDVNYTQTLPFTPGNVYRLNVRNDAPKKVAYSENKAWTNLSTASEFALDNFWAFERVAGTINDFKIYCLGAGQYINGNGFSAAGKAYSLGEFTGRDGGFNFVVSGTTNNALGDHTSVSGQGNVQLGEWSGGSNKNDVGSCFWVGDITTEISNLTTIGSAISHFLGLQERSVSETAKTTAAASPTIANVKALFNVNAENLAVDGKYFRMRTKDSGRTTSYASSNIHAEADGSIVSANNDRYMGSFDATGGLNSMLKFELESEGKYYIQHVNSGKYFFGATSGHIDLPLDKANAGTYEFDQIEGKWWGIKRSGTQTYVHQGEGGSSNHLILWGGRNAENASVWEIEEVTEIPLTIKASKWASACYPVAVTLPAGLTAYYAVKASSEGIGLDPVEGTVVPANTPVVITGEADTYNLTIGGEADEIEGNLFTGTTVARQGYDENVGFRYGLSNGNFARITGTSIAANKAFIESENDLAAAGSTLRVYIFEDTLTGIDAVETPAEQGAYFDLNGRMVAYPTTGVYVRNGKKIFVK